MFANIKMNEYDEPLLFALLYIFGWLKKLSEWGAIGGRQDPVKDFHQHVTMVRREGFCQVHLTSCKYIILEFISISRA